MSTSNSPLEKRIRFAAVLVFIAMVATGASLMINHPLSFVGFALFGLTLTLVGIIYYLIALVRGDKGKPTAPPQPPISGS